MKKYINTQTGDVITDNTYKMLSETARSIFKEIQDYPQEQGMTIGEGIATTAVVVALAPAIMVRSLFSLLD